VAETGPSLTTAVANQVESAADRFFIIAVNDAYRVIPSAHVLYACDAKWWEVHEGCPGFAGEKWSSHGETNDKRSCAEKFGLKLVEGKHADTFGIDRVHYGSNSGFQAVNLAMLFGFTRIILTGFDMHNRAGRHFFGDHPKGLLNNDRYESFVPAFEYAAKHLPAGIEVINATPGSAITCFPMMDLPDALSASP
jgi:hypothetical protein